jgi:zinc transporter 9
MLVRLQIILAYGIKKSTEQATDEHPYGYSNMQYVSSLISGVGIFCMGAGLSIYHGIIGLGSPQQVQSWESAFRPKRCSTYCHRILSKFSFKH